MYTDLKELLKSIVDGSKSLKSLSKSELKAVEAAMTLIKAKYITPSEQKKNKEKSIKDSNVRAGHEADLDIKQEKAADKEPIKKPSWMKVIKADSECMKVSKAGQWSLDKTTNNIKPGPVLNYKEMNPKPDYPKIEAQAPTIDYHNDQMKTPSRFQGTAERAAATRARLDAESKESAIDSIQRRQKIKKGEGTLVDKEPSSKDKKKMIAKQDIAGDANTKMLTMSDKY